MKFIKISGLYSEAVLKQPRFFINLVMIGSEGALQKSQKSFCFDICILDFLL